MAMTTTMNGLVLDRSETSSETTDPLDIRDDEGWEDIEPDIEAVNYVSLFDGKTFPDLMSMLEYDRSTWNFDLIKIQKELDLDFLEKVKLVNFVRSEVRHGNKEPACASKDQFSSDVYLKPVLEDDAVLYSLDEMAYFSTNHNNILTKEDQFNGEEVPISQIDELEEQLSKAQETIRALRELSDRLIEARPDAITKDKDESKMPAEDDSHYFKSYDYRDIHETMLKDNARTDAYRDFVYDNKNLFKDKVVLDVGCGTGILSMMCAKAGARQVFAVDNSQIINKARENVFANGLERFIICVHGKIEEIQLPIEKVDIIISEWMGYALLYEAMLDSVLWARDKWLKPGGILVPSDVQLCIAPMADPNLIMEKVTFWNDVYGFDMRSMQEAMFDEPMILDAQASTIIGTDCPPTFDSSQSGREPNHAGQIFFSLDLYSATVSDLTFSRLPFYSRLTRGAEALDGFVIWFDALFSRPGVEDGDIWLSTGPAAPPTHWAQTILLVDHLKRKPVPLKEGQIVKGSVDYERPEDNPRQLRISVRWQVEENGVEVGHGTEEKTAREQGQQMWKLE